MSCSTVGSTHRWANKGDHVRSCTEVDDDCTLVVQQQQDSISARTEIRQH